ncbi:MAG: hypothetical protein RSB41_02540 [Bacilli bacterium]
MYSSKKSFGFDWMDIVSKVVFLIIFVLLMLWLFPKVPNMTAFYSNVFRENISYMKDAAKSYYTNERLPKNIGDSQEITLQEMINKSLILPFVDKDGYPCDTQSSYVQVTKQQSEYSMKVNLVCKGEKNYIVETLGCYNYCENCTKPVENKSTGGSGSGYIPSTPTPSKPNTVGNIVIKNDTNNSVNVGGNNNSTITNGTDSGVDNNVVGDNNNIIIDNHPDNSVNIYPEVWENRSRRDDYVSIVAVGNDVNYIYNNQIVLKTPDELLGSKYRNVRIADVRYLRSVNRSDVSNYTNNFNKWYKYGGGHEWDITDMYYQAKALNTPNMNFSSTSNGYGYPITWYGNYDCINVNHKNRCMYGITYEVTWSYDERTK